MNRMKYTSSGRDAPSVDGLLPRIKAILSRDEGATAGEIAADLGVSMSEVRSCVGRAGIRLAPSFISLELGHKHSIWLKNAASAARMSPSRFIMELIDRESQRATP